MKQLFTKRSFLTASALILAAKIAAQTDTVSPRLTAIHSLAGSFNEVHLTFDNPVDIGSATNRATYNLDALPLLDALVSSDGLRVTLRTGPQKSGQTYPLTITGLKDRAAARNALNTSVTFVATVSYVDEILADSPVRYWRFNETAGTNVATLVALKDTLSSASGNLVNEPALGVPGLVPNLPGDTAVRFIASSNNYIAVPNGSDLNITAGPWAKRTFSFWFKAASRPRGGPLPEAPVLWEEGGNNRGAAIYLYGAQDADGPTEALLVWNVYNNAADGASGGWGVALDSPENAVFVTAPVQADRVYHVVAVFDGDPLGTAGELRLYLNGQLAGAQRGAGQLFNHSANIQIGRGAFLRHDGVTAGNLHYFDGVLDELSIYSQALTAERIAQLYQIGLTPPTTPAQPPFIQIRLEGGNIVLSWEGPAKLERADSPPGPFVEVPGAASPYTESVGAAPARFFRLAR